MPRNAGPFLLLLLPTAGFALPCSQINPDVPRISSSPGRLHTFRTSLSSRTRQNKTIALQRITCEGAKLSSTEMALFEMLVVSGTEEFRAIARIIK